jgi:hypothetical protein
MSAATDAPPAAGAATAAAGVGGAEGGSAAGAAPPTDLFALCAADGRDTLGGLAGDVEAEHPSTIGHMVRSLMPGQDLTRVTIPAWFLETRSLLERMADMMMHPHLLLGCVRGARRPRPATATRPPVARARPCAAASRTSRTPSSE